MGLGRRKARLEDASAWVFNRMADVYDARPPYPAALIAQLAEAARTAGPRTVDIGAGIGHLSLPLARAGLDVVAVEPAERMLAALRGQAERDALSVRALHGTAEALPLATASVDFALIADAVHFLDAERAGRELSRVLVPRGVLAIVLCEVSDTPYMRALTAVMQEAAPRRPRSVEPMIGQLAALAGVSFESERVLEDHQPVDRPTLERILRSISFIGPAMSPARFEAFRARVHALAHAPVWSRTLRVRIGRRRAR